jgi:hypothetical protein
MAKIRVLYIRQNGLITGSVIGLRNVIKGLDKDLFEAHIVIPNDGPARSIWESIGIALHILPFSTFWTSSGSGFFT